MKEWSESEQIPKGWVKANTRESYTKIPLADFKDPDLSCVVDDDILKSVEDSNLFYSDIINMQLIRTLKELTIAINKSDSGT